MHVYEHPHLGHSHVLLDVRECPQMFRMLTDVAGVRDAVTYDPALEGFVMTLDLYRKIRHGLQNATSLLDLVGLCPPNAVGVDEPPMTKTTGVVATPPTTAVTVRPMEPSPAATAPPPAAPLPIAPRCLRSVETQTHAAASTVSSATQTDGPAALFVEALRKEMGNVSLVPVDPTVAAPASSGTCPSVAAQSCPKNPDPPRSLAAADETPTSQRRSATNAEATLILDDAFEDLGVDSFCSEDGLTRLRPPAASRALARTIAGLDDPPALHRKPIHRMQPYQPPMPRKKHGSEDEGDSVTTTGVLRSVWNATHATTERQAPPSDARSGISDFQAIHRGRLRLAGIMEDVTSC